jgi:hypothetical protein
MFQVLAVVMEPRITLATTNTVVVAFFLTNTTRKLSLLWRWHSGRQPQDFVSNQLIAVSGGMADKRPFQTSTDGNCLFNSACIATFGDQSKAVELRVLTCLEMLEHSVDVYMIKIGCAFLEATRG